MPPARTGNVVAPHAQREAEPEAGRGDGVRAGAGKEERRRRDADHDRVERLVERGALELDRAQQRLGVRRRRRAAVHGRGRHLARHALDDAAAQPVRHEREPAAQARRREPLEDLLLVRVAAEDVRQVEHERHAERRRARGEQPLELRAPDPSPATCRARAATPRPIAAQRLAAAGLEQRGRPAVQHGLRGGHGHDQVGLDERARDAQRHRPGRADLDEVLGLGVVDDHAPAEAPPELGRDEEPDLARRRPPQEPARDEDRHLPNAEPLQLVDRRRDRLVPRLGRRRRDRQRRHLDHDRRGAVAGHELGQRPPGERKPHRLPHGRADVLDLDPRRRRPQHDAVLGHVDRARCASRAGAEPAAPRALRRALGGGGRRAEHDEDAARDPAADAAGALARAQLSGERGRGERVRAVGQHGQQRRTRSRDRDLLPGRAAVGVDELRQEREEEQRRLRVEHVHDRALDEELARRSGRGLRLGLDRRPRAARAGGGCRSRSGRRRRRASRS